MGIGMVNSFPALLGETLWVITIILHPSPVCLLHQTPNLLGRNILYYYHYWHNRGATAANFIIYSCVWLNCSEATKFLVMCNANLTRQELKLRVRLLLCSITIDLWVSSGTSGCRMGWKMLVCLQI